MSVIDPRLNQEATHWRKDAFTVATAVKILFDLWISSGGQDIFSVAADAIETVATLKAFYSALVWIQATDK